MAPRALPINSDRGVETHLLTFYDTGSPHAQGSHRPNLVLFSQKAFSGRRTGLPI